MTFGDLIRYTVVVAISLVIAFKVAILRDGQSFSLVEYVKSKTTQTKFSGLNR